MQNTEHRQQSTEHRAQTAYVRCVLSFVCHLSSVICYLYSVFFILFSVSACSTMQQLPPPPPKYIHEEENIAKPSANSLWSDAAGLYEDTKARRLNDLVMIRLNENISGSGEADTNTSRDSSADFKVSDLFGANTDFNLHNLALLNGFYKGANVFSPTVSGSSISDFKGKGDTKKRGRLTGTITAKVVEVMPNGNLVLESRKEITINRDKQILVLRGMVRPYDIDANNTILSSMIADAQVYYVGDGVIQDKQGQGWLVRFLDTIWPF